MKISAAIAVVPLSFLLGGCPWNKVKPETQIVPKVVEAPKSLGPDECLKYHKEFVKLAVPKGKTVLAPSDFLDYWKLGSRQYNSLLRDHAVCRAWHIERRTLLSKEPASKSRKSS